MSIWYQLFKSMIRSLFVWYEPHEKSIPNIFNGCCAWRWSDSATQGGVRWGRYICVKWEISNFTSVNGCNMSYIEIPNFPIACHCQVDLYLTNSISVPKPPVHQVEAEAELRGWQGFQGWARIRSHAETTDHSRKLASAIVCRWRRSGHVTRSLAWLIPHILLK